MAGREAPVGHAAEGVEAADADPVAGALVAEHLDTVAARLEKVEVCALRNAVHTGSGVNLNVLLAKHVG